MIGLVLGGADCVWDDVDALEAMTGPWSGVVIAVNQIGAHWPRRLDHWATLHPEHMQPWLEARAANGYPAGYTVWAHEKKRWHSSVGRDLVDRTLPVPMQSGSSGMFGLDVAKAAGSTRRVLCGIPMTATPHFTGGKPWKDADRNWTWPRWLERRAELTDVRSMSGRTRELLGAPTREWLSEGVPA